MNRIHILVLCALLFCQTVSAVEREPDWRLRAKQIEEEEIAKFKPPTKGETITVVRRIGGEYTGAVREITKDTITLGAHTFQASQLIPETCDRVFAQYHAATVAQQRLAEEREDYKRRKAREEKRKLRKKAAPGEIEEEETAPAPDEKSEVEERLRLEREAKERQIEQQRLETERKNEELAKRRKSSFISLSVFFVVAGVFVYILPSMIALKRKHQKAGTIMGVNILLGWTLLGWIISLVWALSKTAGKIPPVKSPPETDSPPPPARNDEETSGDIKLKAPR